MLSDIMVLKKEDQMLCFYHRYFVHSILVQFPLVKYNIRRFYTSSIHFNWDYSNWFNLWHCILCNILNPLYGSVLTWVTLWFPVYEGTQQADVKQCTEEIIVLVMLELTCSRGQVGWLWRHSGIWSDFPPKQAVDPLWGLRSEGLREWRDYEWMKNKEL